MRSGIGLRDRVIWFVEFPQHHNIRRVATASGGIQINGGGENPRDLVVELHPWLFPHLRRQAIFTRCGRFSCDLRDRWISSSVIGCHGSARVARSCVLSSICGHKASREACVLYSFSMSSSAPTCKAGTPPKPLVVSCAWLLSA